MKLRIRGNSIRLRLSQTEVAGLEDSGRVTDQIVFGPGAQLAYALVVDKAIDVTQAAFEDGTITVAIPGDVMATWLDPAEVSIHGSQPLAEGEPLEILVEKDFACLEPREGEDQENLFVNPGSNPC